MVVLEVVNFLEVRDAYDNSYYAEYMDRGWRKWCFVNMRDFNAWLCKNDFEYYRILKKRHFFASDGTLCEEFHSTKQYRKEKASETLGKYLSYCAEYGKMPDVAGKIDLSTTSPLFRDLQYYFLSGMYANPCITIRASKEGDYLQKRFGSEWWKKAIDEGKKYGYEFYYDGSDLLYGDKRCRTMFYDSGMERACLGKIEKSRVDRQMSM